MTARSTGLGGSAMATTGKRPQVGDRFEITGGVIVEIIALYRDGAVRYRLPDGAVLLAEAPTVRTWKAVAR